MPNRVPVRFRAALGASDYWGGEVHFPSRAKILNVMIYRFKAPRFFRLGELSPVR
jgi:hypothetical protein